MTPDSLKHCLTEFKRNGRWVPLFHRDLINKLSRSPILSETMNHGYEAVPFQMKLVRRQLQVKQSHATLMKSKPK